MMTPPGSSRDRVHVDFLNDSVVPAAQDAVEARLRRKGSNLVAFPVSEFVMEVLITGLWCRLC